MSSDPVARDGTGDDKEHRDEVLAVSITPVQSEKSGHDVSGGGPERNEAERGPGRRELYARLNVSSQLKNKGAPRRRGPDGLGSGASDIICVFTFRSGGRSPALAAGPPPAVCTIQKNKKCELIA